MRFDMDKVIVERPRAYRGHRGRRSPSCGHRTRRGRAAQNRFLPEDLEHAPRHEAMGRGYREKSLNENLAPLIRWLFKQVGRSWSSVYRELRGNLQSTSTVQKHVLDHVRQFVHLHTFLNERGQRCARVEKGVSVPIVWGLRRGVLYVCAATGILKVLKLPNVGDLCVRKICDAVYLVRTQGVWWHVTTAPRPSEGSVQDVFVHGQFYALLSHRVFGAVLWPGRYACAKRILSKKERSALMQSNASHEIKLR